MTNFKTNRLMTALFSIVIFIFVGLVGCSQCPTGIDEQESAALLKRSLSAQKVLGDAVYTEAVISASEGGTLILNDVELYFPPKALANDTLISIDIPDMSVFANNFGTNGLVFNVPVRVTMSYRDADLTGITETNIKMAWFNDRTGTWDIIDCKLDSVNKRVIANVYHFSAYGLISD